MVELQALRELHVQQHHSPVRQRAVLRNRDEGRALEHLLQLLGARAAVRDERGQALVLGRGGNRHAQGGLVRHGVVALDDDRVGAGPLDRRRLDALVLGKQAREEAGDLR